MSTNELDITNSRNSRLLADSFSNSRDCDDGDTSNESADENESADLALEAHFQLKSRRSSSHSLINERLSVCSSPINAIKMSSRVCQIKIDEGIEPHLNREIKSERETQNTLKLKSSYDELIIDPNINNNDDNSMESNQLESKFKRYRASSESLNQNIPSPLSPSSYSNASSPRCFSPFHPKPSISPSPTRKVFVTRRSMSPVQLLKQLSSVSSTSTSTSSSSMSATSTKRKLNDLENESNSSKKHHKDDKFLHPLDLYSKYTFQPIKNNQKQLTISTTQLTTQITTNTTTTNDFLTPIDSPCSTGYQSSIQNNSDSESCTS